MPAAPRPSSISPSRSPRAHRAGSLRARVGLVGVALMAAAAIGGAGVGGAGTAQAAPTVPDSLVPTTMDPSTMELGAIPLDSTLAEAVRTLRAAGVDQMALKAAQAVISSVGQISPDELTTKLGALPLDQLPIGGGAQTVAATDPLAPLTAAGIQTFTPSVAPFCAAPTADNPLGLVTAGAGAVAGPWPLKTEPTTPINDILALIPGIKPIEPLNLVEQGQVGYAFVPSAATTDGKMQVAWFNTSTLKGGFTDLEPLVGTQQSALVRMMPLLGGLRLAPVTTGSGTVLSAVYGTARNGTQTCYFLPAVGVVDAH